MLIDENTYWRGTFTVRAQGGRPKVTKVYTIAVPRKDIDAVQGIASGELAPIFQRASGQLVEKPVGGFVRVTHPERMHDRVSAGGYPVWLEARSRY